MLSGKKITLGRNRVNRKDVYITPKERTTHMQVIGSTGTGKSKFLENLLREDISKKNGLCLIDPHGTLYNDLIKWCETHRLFNKRKIILFDPSEDNWSFGFNPLRLGEAELSYHVDKMVEAVAKVWGGEDSDKTPRLKRILRMIFYVLAEKDLTLLESRYLLSSTDNTVRKYLTNQLADRDIQPLWDHANILKPGPFMDQFESAINRMMEFLSSPIVKNTIGHKERTIDFKKLMDEGGILLVNLSSKNISRDNARLLGTLLVNDLVVKSLTRPPGSRPFYLYIDECGRYINDDIAIILDECRKFGLHLILAHQHLDQLRAVSDVVYNSVLTDAKTKVVFGGLSPDDGEVMSKQVFMGELDLEESVKALEKPVVVGHGIVELKGRSSGHSSTVARGNSTTDSNSVSGGSSSGKSITRSTEFLGDDIVTDSTGSNSSFSTGSAKTGSYSESTTHSEAESVAESLKPILKEMAGAVHGLDKQQYKATAKIVNQPTQCAIIKLPEKSPKSIRVPTVKPGYANDKRVERFKQKVFEETEFAFKKLEGEKLIEHRMKSLEEEALKALTDNKKEKVKADPKSFRG